MTRATNAGLHRNQMINFIWWTLFCNKVPDRVSKNLVLCSPHFYHGFIYEQGTIWCGIFFLNWKTILCWIYTALQKFGNALEKWGFGQYWHKSFLICDNFALIRDNTNLMNFFDSSKFPPLAAITALHYLGIRAVSLFKHWLWIGNQLLKLQY